MNTVFLIKRGGGTGPKKPQQPAKQGKVLIPASGFDAFMIRIEQLER